VDGESGWVHQALLSGKRMVWMHAKEVVLRTSPGQDATPLLRAQYGVVGQLIECSLNWCRVQVDNVKGWAPKDSLWGVYPHEVLKP
jgi:SH3-like domain-containing protein